MRYGIIINLDYVTYLHDPVKCVYQEIQQALAEEGFLRDGRLFIIGCSAMEAQKRARRAVDTVEARHVEHGESIYPYIKEFFGFHLHHTTNLLLPPSDDIRVVELSDLDGVEGVETIVLRGGK